MANASLVQTYKQANKKNEADQDLKSLKIK